MPRVTDACMQNCLAWAIQPCQADTSCQDEMLLLKRCNILSYTTAHSQCLQYLADYNELHSHAVCGDVSQQRRASVLPSTEVARADVIKQKCRTRAAPNTEVHHCQRGHFWTGTQYCKILTSILLSVPNRFTTSRRSSGCSSNSNSNSSSTKTSRKLMAIDWILYRAGYRNDDLRVMSMGE